MAYKQQGVDGNTQGVAFLMKKNKITTLHGTAKIAGAGKVEVAGNDGKAQMLETKNIVIATGSDVAQLPGIEIDEKQVVSSTGALELTKIPNRMILVGGGVIGLELGSVWRRLGSQVLVVEFLDRILPGMDLEVAKNFQRILKKQGMEFKLKSKVTGVRRAARASRSASSRRPAAMRRRSRPMWCWSVSAGFPSPRGSGSKRPASSSTIAAGSRPTGISRPMWTASTPSAT